MVATVYATSARMWDDDVLVVVVVVALAVRACVGLYGYSGEAKPPMYGDFECQRHWM
jgi:alpha-1,3-glucosyltransferase